MAVVLLWCGQESLLQIAQNWWSLKVTYTQLWTWRIRCWSPMWFLVFKENTEIFSCSNKTMQGHIQQTFQKYVSNTKESHLLIIQPEVTRNVFIWTHVGRIGKAHAINKALVQEYNAMDKEKKSQTFINKRGHICIYWLQGRTHALLTKIAVYHGS